MSKILEAIDHLASQSYNREWGNPAIRQFLITGDASLLNSIPPSLPDWPSELVMALPDPGDWTEEAQNVLRLAIARPLPGILQGWVQRYAKDDQAEWGMFPAAVEKLRAVGVQEPAIRGLLLQCPLWDWRHLATPAGKLLLEGPDEELIQGMKVLRNYGQPQIPPLLAYSQPDRLQAMLDNGLKFANPATVFGLIARANPARFSAQAYECCQSLASSTERVGLAMQLVRADKDTYLEYGCREIRAFCINVPEGGDPTGRACAEFVLEHGLPDAEDLICAWMAGFDEQNDWNAPFQREMILQLAKEKHPELIPRMAQACARCESASVTMLGLHWWRDAGVGDAAPAFRDALREFLARPDPSAVVLGISEARSFDIHLMQDDLWPLMEHKSRPVRSAAARALASLGYAEAAEKALKLLVHKKADIRQAAVQLLSQTAAPEAMRDLKLRLDLEENDDVRDDILLALERAGSGAALSPEELQARMAKSLAKAKGAPAPWISVSTLKFLRQNGTALSSDEVLYLLIRQSRCKAMRADLEVKPLYAALDRTASGESALALMQAFLGSGQDASDRWAMAAAALTGDDRLVPVLRKAILDWADNSRGKLAEYGAQALALLGTEAALMVVDSLSVRFRTKNKNIGQAAADAFAAAAEARGVTVEELGDLVVPWLGFEPGKPRTVTTAKAQVEARIDAEFKLSFRDPKTGKVMTKLPAGASADVQTEFKTLAGTLKEAVKAQLLRMETLLVRQFRWPAARWQDLYLAHPLLRPFTQRLIWAWCDASGALAGTFRALEDGTLSDVEDKPVSLRADGSVSLVHPLELTDEVRAAWIQHLADYDVTPPFAQLDRPAIRCTAEDAGLKFGNAAKGVQINGMTFRSRSEKLGWSRGSVCDNGTVSSYRKIYSGAGVEAFLDIDGMDVGMSMDQTVTLGRVCFVKAGSVQVGSYVYDDPRSDTDPRLIAFGDVPAVPFSETMGDLVKICGTAAGAETPSE